MAEEDFVVETYVDLIRKAHEEIHTVYVRESRKLAENLRNFIQNLIISQGFPGHGTNKNTKYQKWKDKHGNGLNIELVLTGQLLYDSIIIKQIDFNDEEYPDEELVGGYKIDISDDPVTPRAIKARKLKVKHLDTGQEASYFLDRSGKYRVFTLRDLWTVIEWTWNKPVIWFAKEKYKSNRLTNRHIYDRIEKEIMEKYGLYTSTT